MIPDCIMLDVLLYNDRETLEILQLANRRFNDFIQSRMTTVCLRSIRLATFTDCGREARSEIELSERSLECRRELREISSRSVKREKFSSWRRGVWVMVWLTVISGRRTVSVGRNQLGHGGLRTEQLKGISKSRLASLFSAVRNGSGA